MALTPNLYSNNPFQPGIVQDAFIPDQLIGGDLKIVTKAPVTFLTGQIYQRGQVLGIVTATGKYTLALSASADGSQTPVAIAVDQVDATSADALGGVYVMGEFNANAVLLGTGITLAAATAALAAQNIYLKTPVSAADPT
jgi:hypothetical protein